VALIKSYTPFGAVFRIRIRIRIGSGFNQVCGSGSGSGFESGTGYGSRGMKNTKNEEKIIFFTLNLYLTYT